ncbi:hypothetical protein AOC36_11585 [Erysipelothrix larvae]|uniref:ATPase n=1 Tax=Erysipelothrix larvae TaxID=1514105 RepID=A0A120JU13_9FIRM|nr:V-type ATPase subunit [Erysipelothrix larvae]AMC94591.1 hypothetical protein AOC36_11585 [Erysipelothrix larvae]
MPNTAVIAKARAMYSLHLKDFDYHQLADLKRVEDVAMFFEKHPRYEGVMEGVRSLEIHRDILEQRIRVMVPLEYKSLLRMEQVARAKTFFSLDLERNLIVDMLYSLSHGVIYQPTRDSVELSQSFSFNVADLINCNSIEAVLKTIARSPYAHTVDVEVNKGTPIWEIESKLYDLYIKLVNENEAKDSEEFRDIFRFDIELTRVAEAFRMVIANNPNYIKKLESYTWIPYKLKKQELKDWVEQSDPNLFVANVKEKYGIPQEVYRSTIENYFDRMRFKQALKVMRYSQDSKAVVYAYKMLMDIEVKNIISIIEGVRYRRNVQSILEQLVFEVKQT